MGNYKYDKTGNLIQDLSEEIGTIKWTSTGKVREVKRYPPDNEKPDLEFFYDANDNRIGKLTKPNINDKKTWKYTFYSRDHSGNIMATYNIQYNNDTNLYVLSLKEQILYGSDLLGVYNDSIVIGFSNYIKFNPDNHLEVIGPILHILDEQQSYLDTGYFATMHKYHGITGNIAYQLTNHLGNVHTTISDKPLLKDVTGDGLADEKRAIILSSGDYYPFGMLKQGRNFYATDYRFGFNGMEKDDEITGITGANYTAMFWEYDSRTGRRWNVDPVVKPWESSYACFSNNPIWFIDPLGTDTFKVSKQGDISFISESEDDILFATNKQGDILKDKLIAVDKGVLGGKKTRRVEDEDTEEKFELDRYRMTGDDKAEELHKFLGKNTNVEWGLTGIGTSESESNVLTTIHEKRKEAGGPWLLKKNYTIRYSHHSHPFGLKPSGKDKKFAKSLNLKFGKAKLKILFKDKYYEFNEKGLVPYTLPEVTITPK